MSELHIKAKIRDSAGKSHARRLRRAGEIPCVLYGIEKDNVQLALPRHEFEKLLSETRSVFVVDYGDTKQRTVVKEIQYHPVKGDMIHVDLIRVKAGQELTVSVPLSFVGNAAGVKMGGIFQEIRAELEITCLPKYLPNELEIDISHLEIGDSIHVGDLKFDHITIDAEPELSICSIVVPKKVEELLPEAEEEEGEEEEAAEPEVIGAKAKREEGEEEEEERSEG
jgi:large subunit ribosomal protein L25